MIKNTLKYINVILELSKIKITTFVGLSTFVGYVLYSRDITNQMFWVIFGVFLLSCGSSALNHYQERYTDSLMLRTKNRPIPSGRISPHKALLTSLIMILISIVIIYFSSNLLSTFLALLALVWYNFVYTPMKKKFAFAVIPGSIIGALPPIIGYTAAGGSLFSFEILSLALFFFIWQVPHFWLLLLIFDKDYKQAGFPTLTKIFNEKQLIHITFSWISSLAFSSFLFLITYSYRVYSVIALIFLSLWLIFESRKILLKFLEKNILREMFIRINLYVLAVIAIISIDKLLLKEI